MVRVNKKQIRADLKEEIWRRLWSVIRESGSGEKLASNMRRFLTIAELTAFEKRLAVSALLGRGLSYSKIGEILGVSPVTINFIKNNLKRKVPVVRNHVSSRPIKIKDEYGGLGLMFPSRSKHGKAFRDVISRGR